MSDDLREAVARALYHFEGHKFGWDTQPDNDIREWHRGQADAAIAAARPQIEREAREACAKLADNEAAAWLNKNEISGTAKQVAQRIAAAIRKEPT